MNKIILLYALLLSLTTYGQENQTNPKDTGYSHNTYLTFDIINTVVPEYSRYNFGVFYPLTPKISLGSSIGFGRENISAYQEDNDYKLFELRPQLIYHFDPHWKSRQFVSLELFYITSSSTLTSRYYVPENDLPDGIEAINYSSAKYEREKYGILFNYGWHIKFSKRIGFRLSNGIGIAFKDRSFSNIINPTFDDFPDYDFDIFSSALNNRTEGKKVRIEYNLSVLFAFSL